MCLRTPHPACSIREHGWCRHGLPVESDTTQEDHRTLSKGSLVVPRTLSRLVALAHLWRGPSAYFNRDRSHPRHASRHEAAELALRLHDEVGQWLVFALLHVDRAMASGRELHDALDPVRTGLQRSSQAVRKMIEELDDGMTCAAEGSLQAAIDAALSNSPWSHCPLQLDLDPSLSDIPSAFAPLAARMIGELVGNAHRHAHASMGCQP